MFCPYREINIKAPAQGVKTKLAGADIFPARQGNGVEHLVFRQVGAVHGGQFRIQETQIKIGVVGNQRGAIDKGQKLFHYHRKQRFISEKILGQAVHVEGFFGHVPLWV